jgi:hypothetical protein
MDIISPYASNVHSAVGGRTGHRGWKSVACVDIQTQGGAVMQQRPRPSLTFASTEEGNILTPNQQRAKLERVIEVADEVWGSA